MSDDKAIQDILRDMNDGHRSLIEAVKRMLAILKRHEELLKHLCPDKSGDI